jgi:hypothetical protein
MSSYENLYYNDWLNSYKEYLYVIYNRILPIYYDINNLSFNKFCEFIYDHSSGYISQYT